MPELAIIYSVGCLFSLIVGCVFSLQQRAQYKSEKFLKLQRNLKQINLRYNDLESAIEDNIEGASVKEYSRARNTYMLFTSAATILSWLGLFFLILLWFSIKKLISNKTEIKLFASKLALLDLTEAEVQGEYKKLFEH